MAQTTFLQAEILSKDICAYEDEIDTFAVALKSSQVRTKKKGRKKKKYIIK